MKRHYIPVTADVPGVSDSTKSFLRKVIRTALTEQGVNVPCEVDVYVTGDAGIQELNREMRRWSWRRANCPRRRMRTWPPASRRWATWPSRWSG